METLNIVLFWANIVILSIIVLIYLLQLLFGVLFFLKPRKYKKAEKYHDFTVIIRAHNEEDVIADSVDSALKCNYPEEKKHVVVFCHNCSDNTAKIAREHGARTIEFEDHDPKHQKASYCMKLGMEQLKKDGEGKYEYFLFIDADNQLDENYMLRCNDAADEGVELGRTYENSKNLTDNLISCMTGLWYIRDNRFACSARSALHAGCVMNGCCSMVKAEYALDWDAMSASDDIEFTLNRLLKDGKKVEYISEAMVYEDQPTSLGDMFKRNTRMGNGLNKLFWTTGIRCIGRFFKTLFNPKVKASMKLTYWDQGTNNAAIPGAILAIAWLPLYCIYTLIYTGLGNTVVTPGVCSFDFLTFLLIILIAAGAAYLIPFFFQPLLCAITERKKIVVKKKSILFFSILFYPFYMLIQGAGIIVGIFSKPKWKKIKRSTTKIEQ
jgi:cellulose synthase/poly-beta-1,6-N-acetylglucosamine synthase-like glycosyltransferase